ncbi:hypothetical protein WA026_018101 [Henosepilachna vigintioctopunctata]
MIRRQESAALFISLIDMNFEICSVMRSTVGLDDFQLSLELLIDCFCINTPDENEEIIDNSGYKDFQQRMLDGLGNRDYDLFESNEMEYLKEKIAFALFGMPIEESGYADKQEEERDKMYETIIKQSNKYLEYKNQVVISVIYNCLVPLDNNDDNGYTPVPVFILRKCRESSEPCRIIIDHTRRVYNSWNDYLQDNKFCKCLMVVPQNGRYTEDDHGKVKLEKVKSPSCNPAKKALKVADITSSVLGIGSSGVFAVAAIPAITIAPAALLGAAAVGAGVGIYSLGRSIHTLVDRGSHDESLNVTEAESRAAYINIAGGALGFAGAGANAAVSQLAANGISIGTSARIAVNTINVANIGIGGLGIGNSAVEIIMRWWIDDERPSTFTVLQLSTSILFFGHAVYSFKTAGTIIEEAQNNYLNDYRKYLRSNKHRKMFKKLELDTIRMNDGDITKANAEIISATLKIKNKDDVFSFLVKSNKKFNKMGIKFSAKGGNVSFNGVALDLSEITNLSQSDIYSYFSDISQKPTSNTSTSSINFDFGTFITVDNAVKLSNLLSIVIGRKSLREKITIILKEFFDHFNSMADGIDSKIKEYFNEQFSTGVRYLEYTNVILSFIKQKVEVLLEKYNNGEDNSCNLIFKYVGDLDVLNKKLFFMQQICDQVIVAFKCPSSILKELEIYIIEWIISANMSQEEAVEKEVLRERANSEKIFCKTCSGYYFK